MYSPGMSSTTTFTYTFYASRVAKLIAEIYCIPDSFTDSSNKRMRKLPFLRKVGNLLAIDAASFTRKKKKICTA